MQTRVVQISPAVRLRLDLELKIPVSTTGRLAYPQPEPVRYTEFISIATVQRKHLTIICMLIALSRRA
jgi:hypothetical protein